MKRISFYLATMMLSAVVLSSTSFATEQTIKDSNNQISVKFVLKKLAYEENGNGVLGSRVGLLDTEKGYVPGYGIDLTFMGNVLLDKDYLDLKFSHSTGHTDYVGSLIGGSFGSVTDTSSARLLDFSARIGEGFTIDKNYMLTPFLEIGHHKWYRGVNAGETYNHSYYGGGLLAQTSIGNKFVLSLNGMIGRTFSSTIDVTSDFIPGFSGNLGNGITYRFGASADYAITKDVHINLGVDHTRFKYGMTKLFPVPGFPGFFQWEPNSKSRYTVFNAGIGIAF